MEDLRVVIITGLSGSGKSTALRALEDIGFFCVDNLPVVLLPRFLKITADESHDIADIAMVMDLRQQSFLEKYSRIFNRLKDRGYRIEILFLDAGDDALLNRFSETRRVHPLSGRGSVMEGILRERGRSPCKLEETIVRAASGIPSLDQCNRPFASGPWKEEAPIGGSEAPDRCAGTILGDVILL